MQNININQILERENIETQIIELLNNFNINKQAIYIYGQSGIGKTTFIHNLLKKANYDIIEYDASHIRNKTAIDAISKYQITTHNIISAMNNTPSRRMVILMDEIDGMNNGDKGGISTLIKLIRLKKTKKQKFDATTLNPIICIGNDHMDKKVRELMKVCICFELKCPTIEQSTLLASTLWSSATLQQILYIVKFVEGDLRKFQHLYISFTKNPLIIEQFNNTLFEYKSNQDDTKQITARLFKNCYSLEEHARLLPETDRTSVGLLWHENIIDTLHSIPRKEGIQFYMNTLENICFADAIDRITFQKQIWQFNEMSSIIKTWKNHLLFHNFQKKYIHLSLSKTEQENNDIPKIRFTKVLTKYSTEYNNFLFIQRLCQQLGVDKSDLFSFFIHDKDTIVETLNNDFLATMENYDIKKLDIQRLQRYLEKYLKENTKDDAEKDFEDETLQNLDENIDENID